MKVTNLMGRYPAMTWFTYSMPEIIHTYFSLPLNQNLQQDKKEKNMEILQKEINYKLFQYHVRRKTKAIEYWLHNSLHPSMHFLVHQQTTAFGFRASQLNELHCKAGKTETYIFSLLVAIHVLLNSTVGLSTTEVRQYTIICQNVYNS